MILYFNYAIAGTFIPAMTYTNWISGFGANGGNDLEKNCVVLIAKQDVSLGWKAVNCTEKHHAVCKKTGPTPLGITHTHTHKYI